MAEEKKIRLTRAERQQREREANLKHWGEQDALLLRHRQETYEIGGAAQTERLAKQGKKPMRELIRMLIDPGTDFSNWDSTPGTRSAKKGSTAGRPMRRRSGGIFPAAAL